MVYHHDDDRPSEKLEEYFIGYGICPYFCLENTILIIENQRIVRIAPPRRN